LNINTCHSKSIFDEKEEKIKVKLILKRDNSNFKIIYLLSAGIHYFIFNISYKKSPTRKTSDDYPYKMRINFKKAPR